MPKYYPVYIDISGKKCVIIGGGDVAYRKACGLMDADGIVTVISPEFCQEFMVEKGVTLKEKEYDESDIDGAVIVVASTNNEKVNKKVFEDASKRNILVNVVDQPDLCSFIVPSLIRRGYLCVSISTGGASPALARNIRLSLENRFGSEFADFTELLAKMRQFVLSTISDKKRRSKILKLLAGDQFLEMIKKEGKEKTEEEMRKFVLEFTI